MNKFLHFNKALLLIILLSLILNSLGLFPNTLLHQKEPVLLKPANSILINVVQKGDFDPNVKPNPFIYGSSIIYLHSLVRGVTLFVIYNVHQLTGFDFGAKNAFSDIPNFQQFVTEKTIYFFQDALRVASRFTTVLLGVGAVYLTYKIAESLYKKRSIALLSAFALSVTPLWVRDAHYSTPDIPQNFLFLVAFLFSIKLWQKPTARSYFLAALFVGLSSSLKYFPLSVLPFLYFHFLVSKFQFFNSKLLVSIPAIFIGYFLGMPSLFVHYREILANFNFAAGWYAPKALAENQSILQKLIPPYFHAFHIKFAFTDSILTFPIILSLLGLLTYIRKYKAETFGVLLIPLANTMFITSYLEVTYDYLPLPSLPFFAILTALGCYYLVNWLVEKVNLAKNLALIGIPLIVFVQSFVNNVSSDIACSQQITVEQGKSWITESIPRGTPLATQPNVRVANAWPEVLRSEVKSRYSIEELQEKDIKLSVVISGYTQLFDIWSSDLFGPNQYMVENQFLHLVDREYKDRATLVKKFAKPKMCFNDELFIYKLPEKLPEVNHQIESFSFGDEDDFQGWALNIDNLKQVQLNFSKDEGYLDKGSLYYQHTRVPLSRFTLSQLLFYSPPVYSPSIEAIPNATYTVAGWVKTTEESLGKAPDGFLRLDFYQEENAEPLTFYLSPRATKDSWQKLTTTGIAPQNARFLKIGFQTIAATESGEFWLDDVMLFNNK